VFDLGANMGLFSAMCANYGCLCYAFEPLPVNIENLKALIDVNPHIVLAPYAVSDNDGVVQFINSETISGGTKIKDNNDKCEDIITVNSITLDSFVTKNSIKRVDFIKADIEGAERLMLKGAKNILKEFAPKLSICKYHLPDDPQVLRELILEANSNYIIEERWEKIYAHVPNKEGSEL
jgi:FkbM family methyltransferase